jgi:hypothetical protein
MFKTILATLGLAVSLSAQANTVGSLAYQINQAVLGDVEAQSPFKFVVGDEANYKLNMGGFIQGTMKMKVKAVQTDEVTITQDMSLMGQNQNCEQVLNPNTGEVKKFQCNGQDQNAGDAGDVEVVETKEDTVKVPAGSFVCLYIKAKQKSSGQFVEQWVNPKDVPVFGLVKTIAPSQLGQVVVELTSFTRM